MPARALQLLIRIALFVALTASAALFVDYQSTGAGGFCGEHGAGCGAVKSWAMRYSFGKFIPILGMAVMGVLGLLAAWAREPKQLRMLAGATALAGLGALGFIGLQFWMGSICKWCMAVDLSVVVAAFAALSLVGKAPSPEGTGSRLLWTGALVVAVATPLLWEPPPPPPVEVPEAVQARWVDGKVNVVMFTDFECPYCRRLHPVVDELARGDDRIALHRVMVPLKMHPGAEPAALGYLCTPEDQREAMADALYGTAHGELEASSVVKQGQALGLDPDDLARCMAQESMRKELDADKALFSAAALRGLPSTFVQDQLVVGADQAAFLAAVDRALAGAGDEGGLALGWMFAFLGIVLVAASTATALGSGAPRESEGEGSREDEAA